MAKGTVAVLLAMRFSTAPHLPLAAAVLAVADHNFVPYLRFRSDKGLSALAGGLLILSPQLLLVLLVVTGAGVLVLRDTMMGVAAAITLAPVAAWLLKRELAWVLYGAGLAVMILVKLLPDFTAFVRGRRQLV